MRRFSEGDFVVRLRCRSAILGTKMLEMEAGGLAGYMFSYARGIRLTASSGRFVPSGRGSECRHTVQLQDSHEAINNLFSIKITDSSVFLLQRRLLYQSSLPAPRYSSLLQHALHRPCYHIPAEERYHDKCHRYRDLPEINLIVMNRWHICKIHSKIPN